MSADNIQVICIVTLSWAAKPTSLDTVTGIAATVLNPRLKRGHAKLTAIGSVVCIEACAPLAELDLLQHSFIQQST